MWSSCRQGQWYDILSITFGSIVGRHSTSVGLDISFSPYFALRSQSLPCASKGAILRSSPIASKEGLPFEAQAALGEERRMAEGEGSLCYLLFPCQPRLSPL